MTSAFLLATPCSVCVQLLSVLSVQLFRRIFQSGIGDGTEVGMRWTHEFGAYYCLLDRSMCGSRRFRTAVP